MSILSKMLCLPVAPRRPLYSLQPTALAFVSVLPDCMMEPRPPGRGLVRRDSRIDPREGLTHTQHLATGDGGA